MSPAIGNLNVLPCRAISISTIHRMKLSGEIMNEAIHPMTGMYERIIFRTVSVPKMIIDCIAWNLTNLLCFSMIRKIIPVINPNT
ncbi:hypothetical protein D3C73_1416320 [compost metagenome]